MYVYLNRYYEINTMIYALNYVEERVHIYLIFIYLYYITIYAVLYKKFQIVVICVWDILKVKTKMYKLTILYNE
jgi:hypothetical protein